MIVIHSGDHQDILYQFSENSERKIIPSTMGTWGETDERNLKQSSNNITIIMGTKQISINLLLYFAEYFTFLLYFAEYSRLYITELLLKSLYFAEPKITEICITQNILI